MRQTLQARQREGHAPAPAVTRSAVHGRTSNRTMQRERDGRGAPSVQRAAVQGQTSNRTMKHAVDGAGCRSLPVSRFDFGDYLDMLGGPQAFGGVSSNPLLGDGASGAGAVLAPLSFVMGAKSVYDNTAGRQGNFGLQNLVDTGRGGLGMFSSATTLAGLVGALPTVAGSTSVGAIGAAGAGSVTAAGGAVAGAGLAGYGAGRLLDWGAGKVGEQFGRAPGETELSSLGAAGMTAVDQGTTALLRKAGIFDESRPAYTQTLGWRLAEVLPSWLQ
jgi:hypothetical protein